MSMEQRPFSRTGKNISALVMLLGGTALGVANLRWRAWKARKAKTEIGPIALGSLLACEIEYLPGVPQGYAGYADYTAINLS